MWIVVAITAVMVLRHEHKVGIQREIMRDKRTKQQYYKWAKRMKQHAKRGK